MLLQNARKPTVSMALIRDGIWYAGKCVLVDYDQIHRLSFLKRGRMGEIWQGRLALPRDLWRGAKSGMLGITNRFKPFSDI